jgi:hypothetical protein
MLAIVTIIYIITGTHPLAAGTACPPEILGL